MAKKNELPLITCASCKYATYITVAPGDPQVIQCSLSEERIRKVANARRICTSYIKSCG